MVIERRYRTTGSVITRDIRLVTIIEVVTDPISTGGSCVQFTSGCGYLAENALVGTNDYSKDRRGWWNAG